MRIEDFLAAENVLVGVNASDKKRLLADLSVRAAEMVNSGDARPDGPAYGRPQARRRRVRNRRRSVPHARNPVRTTRR